MVSFALGSGALCGWTPPFPVNHELGRSSLPCDPNTAPSWLLSSDQGAPASKNAPFGAMEAPRAKCSLVSRSPPPHPHHGQQTDRHGLRGPAQSSHQLRGGLSMTSGGDEQEPFVYSWKLASTTVMSDARSVKFIFTLTGEASALSLGTASATP